MCGLFSIKRVKNLSPQLPVYLSLTSSSPYVLLHSPAPSQRDIVNICSISILYICTHYVYTVHSELWRIRDRRLSSDWE